MCSILVELEFGVLAFVEGRKPENLDKNPRSRARANNKLTPHIHGTVPELNPGHIDPPKIPQT